MRTWILAGAMIVASLVAATPADAFHGWHRGHHGGWGGCGGHGWGGHHGRGWGGYRGYGNAWGGYRGYGYAGYGLGYGYGSTLGIGYPGSGLYGAGYAPATNIIITSPAATSAMPNVLASMSPATAAELQRFLRLKEAESSVPVSAPARNFTDVLDRHSNAESRRKAERMIADGDELFRAQKLHSALQKYKLAASTAPDSTEALWRKAHALVATHNYELASTAFKRAIARTEDLGRGGFRLNDLYGGAKMAKIQDFESLAEWALSRSDSPDPYFLLGVQLNYDGEAARAEKFFQKASELAGISGGHIAVFLAPAEEHSVPSSVEPARPAEAAPVAAINAGTEL